MNYKTTDLCDAYGDAVQVAAPLLQHFGGVRMFGGPMVTLQVRADNALVRSTLSLPGGGQVLVIDGGGLLQSALVGDQLAALAQQNGWAGIVVYGAVRDTRELAETAIGIMALAACPRRSAKTGAGARDVPLQFAGISFKPGAYLYADDDGVVVADHVLELPAAG